MAPELPAATSAARILRSTLTPEAPRRLEEGGAEAQRSDSEHSGERLRFPSSEPRLRFTSAHIAGMQRSIVSGPKVRDSVAK